MADADAKAGTDQRTDAIQTIHKFVTRKIRERRDELASCLTRERSPIILSTISNTRQ